MQHITVEQVQQERSRLATAIDNLAKKHGAAENLAVVLNSDTATLAQVKDAFAVYYSAEASALQHDVKALREQMVQLEQIEQHVRLQASGLVVAAPAARPHR